MQQVTLSATVFAAVGMWATLSLVHHIHSLGGGRIRNALALPCHQGRIAERLTGTPAAEEAIYGARRRRTKSV